MPPRTPDARPPDPSPTLSDAQHLLAAGGDQAKARVQFERTLRSALLYAKTVTLGPLPWAPSNDVLVKNRRIGVSLSGLQQFIARAGGDGNGLGLEVLRQWCESGYSHLRSTDDELSERFAVARSIKLTSVKPSGTVSLVSGATPGLHWPEAAHYVRRVRMSSDDELLPPLVEAGYHCEPAVGDERRTMVVTVPVTVLSEQDEAAAAAGAAGTAAGTVAGGTGATEIGHRASNRVRTLDEVSMWEQLLMASFMQRHWADNQVSCTVTFDPVTEGPQLPAALAHFQYMLKGVSFLPRPTSGVPILDDHDCEAEERLLAQIDQPYAQMPYERVSRRQYEALMSGIKAPMYHDLAVPDALGEGGEHVQYGPDAFCDAEACAAATAASVVCHVLDT